MQQSYDRTREVSRRKPMFRLIFSVIATLIIGTLILPTLTASAAVSPSILGLAQSFLVLGGSTVTNTGPTTITGGNLGVSPGTAITGFPPGIVLPPGTIHSGDASAARAENDVTTAYNTLAGQTRTATLTGQNLGSMTLVQGVYFFASSAQLTGQLTLDGKGNPDAVFIFQISSTLTTASNSSVRLINGASPCNVYWQVGSSATLGVGSSFAGSILALTSITANTGASVTGRALARNGAVTLDTNSFSLNCALSFPPTVQVPATATPTDTATNTPTVLPSATPTPTSTIPATVMPTSTIPATVMPTIGITATLTSLPSTPSPTTTPQATVTVVPPTATPTIAPTIAPTTVTQVTATLVPPTVIQTTAPTVMATVPLATPTTTPYPIPSAMPRTGVAGGSTADHGTSDIFWLIVGALAVISTTTFLVSRRVRRH